MAKIPDLVWLIIGIIVTAIAFFTPRLKIFIFLGGIFVAIGVFKLSAKYILSKKETKKEEKRAGITQEPKPSERGFCPNCGSRIAHYQKFCHMCGSKVSH